MTSLQHPLPSGFTAASTTADVIRGIDLTGRVAIVTGGYSGLGRETVRTLAAAGARVVAPARDVERARRALEGVGAVEVEALDLLVPASIDAFARRFLDTGLPLDILITSAGIMALPERTLDGRGYEAQFATNHLGHFQLTARLWPALRAAGRRPGGARVVSVASMGHVFSPVVFDDIQFERRAYGPWLAYGQSKTANILFAVELDARGKADGVRAFALHPGGIVDTGLARHVALADLVAVGAVDADGRPLIDPARDFKSVPQGAATQVWCATSPRLDGLGGLFCADSDVAPLLPDAPAATSIGDFQTRTRRGAGVAAYAVDPDAARRLWAASAAMTGADIPA